MKPVTFASKEPVITEPPGGWANFVDSHWEHYPHCFKNGFAPIADDGDIFRALVNASESTMASPPTLKNIKERNLRFFIGHSPVNMRLADYVPQREDQSLDGYAERLAAALSNQDFTLITNNTQAYDYEIWNRARRFISGLYAIIGIPLNSQIVTYVSKSKRTAGGIHKDPSSNFLFQIRGHKRFRLWPTEVLESRQHLVRGVDYDEIADQALTFELGPGDVLYMPSGYYHLAEADDALSVHVSIIVDVINEMGSQLVMDIAARTVSQRLKNWTGEPFFGGLPQDAESFNFELPPFFSPVVDAFADLTGGLKQSLMNELIRRASSLGCNLPPPVLDAAEDLQDEDVITANQESPILAHVLDGQLYFAANGHGFACPAHPNVVKLIQDFKLPKSYRVRQLLDTYAEENGLREKDVSSLLQTLYRLRGINKL